MKHAVDVTIAVVNYKTRDLLEKCLISVFRHSKGVRFEVVVVDNASGDGSVAMVRKKFPDAAVIANHTNRLAAAGNNQVFRRARGRYILVLNPDIAFLDNALAPMVSFLDVHDRVGAVSCRQVMADGKTDMTCSRFSTPIIEFFSACVLARFIPNKKLLRWFRYGGWDRKSVRKVEVITDTIMLVRTDVMKKLGYYDENLPLFFIEYDLCMRMKQAGYQVWHLGTTAVQHLRGQSTLAFSAKEMYSFYEVDMLNYYRKYFGFWWWLFLFLAFGSNRLYYVIEPALTRVRQGCD